MVYSASMVACQRICQCAGSTWDLALTHKLLSDMHWTPPEFLCRGCMCKRKCPSEHHRSFCGLSPPGPLVSSPEKLRRSQCEHKAGNPPKDPHRASVGFNDISNKRQIQKYTNPRRAQLYPNEKLVPNTQMVCICLGRICCCRDMSEQRTSRCVVHV